MITKLIVYFAYFLKSSDTYSKSKLFFYDLLENSRSPYKTYFDFFMIGVIVLSIFLLLYDVEYQIGTMGGYVEHIILILFIFEYLLRFWIYSDLHLIIVEEHERTLYLNIKFNLFVALKKGLLNKMEYIFSPFALIDLLAILPSYRPLRILRVFLIFRLFKLFRYSNTAKLFSEILFIKRFELQTLLLFTSLLIFIASVSIFVFEFREPETKIHNLFDAFYWAIVTMGTVGYGDIVPYSTGGRLVSITLILTGIGVLGFFTSILIAAFNEKMSVLSKNRIYSEIEGFKNFIIICGYGRVGQEIAIRLHKDKQQFVIIDKNPENIELAKMQNFLAIQNDASKNDVLLSAGITQGAIAVLCITGDDVINVYVTLTSRFLNKEIRIISRANRHDNYNKLLQAGADHVIRPFEIAGLLAAEFLGQPVAFEAISGIWQNRSEVEMETILVSDGASLENQPIAELDLERNKLTLLGVISSNPEHLLHKNKYQVKEQYFYFNPDSTFILRCKDILVVIGRKYSIDHFRDQIEQNRLMARKKQ